MALDATVGGATANSFATVAEATSYHETRPGSTWDSVDDQPAALIEATRLLQALVVWTGAAVDAVQALTWPRSGMFSRNGFAIPTNAIPIDLKYATAEFALQLATADLLSDDDVVKKRITSIRAGSVSLTFDIKKKDQDYIGLFPDVTGLLPDAVLMLLVPSWYVRATQYQTLLMQVDSGA